jgi:hypothetical protein
MAHFAEIDPNGGTVLRVLVVLNEQEHRGQDFLANELGLGGVWIQTSYNNNIRYNYAGIGFTYDATRDAFIPPKPYESWLLDEKTCQWEPPIPMPQDENFYTWNEEQLNWEIKNV